jgi:thioester reductase-like protein
MTGATGFLGRYLVQGLLESERELFLLVRGRDVDEARAKVRKALASLDVPELDRLLARQVHVCLGDLDAPGLGLDATTRELVLTQCEQLVHCGAAVRFDLPLAEARAVNVGGTRAVLELARARQERAPLARVDYVGTAYVAGKRTDLVLESELDGSAGHKNTYEQTKFEAEALVREAQRELPITVFRPSIVVGESERGRTSSFKMIYWPAKVYALGLWRTCPGNPQAPIDLVPVDFVRDAILEISRRPESIGRCFHIAAGAEGATTLGEMAELVRSSFAVRKPVRFVNPAWWMRFVHPVLKLLAFGPSRKVVRTGELYVPYFTQNPLFDVAGTTELLAGSKVVLPRAGDYVHQLFRYCIDTDWGRKPPARLSAHV